MVKKLSRRDALKLGAVGLASFLLPVTYEKNRKKKMIIAFDNSSNSGYQAALDTYEWELGTFVPLEGKPGLIVGVSLFGAATVTSITAQILQLTFIRADTNGNYRTELWALAALPYQGDVTLEVHLSAAVDSMAGAASYSYFGGIGAQGGATGTGTPASKALTTTQPNSMVLANLATQTASGVTHANGQNNLWNVPGASGTGMGADKGLIATPASTTMQYDNITVGHAWAMSAVELLSYQDNPPAIMGM